MQHQEELLKWLNGDMNGEELAAFKQTQTYKEYHKIAAYASRLKPDTLDKEAAYKSFKTKITQKPQPKVIKLPYKTWISTAAAVLVILITSYIFLKSDQKIIKATDDFVQITLPDASEATLNNASQISYNPKDWEDGTRNLELEGEAFFKVNKGSVFKVATAQGTIQVLGTQFNVNHRKGYFEVSCYEGSVQVAATLDTLILKPGDTYRLISGKSELKINNNQTQPSWLDYELSFDEVPYHIVIAALERQFNIQISYPAQLKDQVFTGSFSTKKLESALQGVTLPFGITYKSDKDQSFIFYAE